MSSPSPSPSPIILRSPTKYAIPSTTGTSPPPPPSLEFLHRTWTVTHSTLPMWRSAKNVRITYTPLAPVQPSTTKSSVEIPRLGDLVESVPTVKTWMPQPKRIEGVDTAVLDEEGNVRGWKWVGKGLMLRVAGGSYWEVLGWGERPLATGGGGSQIATTEGDSASPGRVGEEKERWVVTWFGKTMFTPEGLDVYCDRKGGISEGLLGEILEAVKRVEGGGVGELCEGEMRAVEIDDA